MKRTLTIRVKWDAKSTLTGGTVGLWVAGDNIWAYGTGPTPEAAVAAYFETVRSVEALNETWDSWPAAVQYREWLAQPGRNG